MYFFIDTLQHWTLQGWLTDIQEVRKDDVEVHWHKDKEETLINTEAFTWKHQCLKSSGLYQASMTVCETWPIKPQTTENIYIDKGLELFALCGNLSH